MFAMSDNNIYQVTVDATADGQDVQNVLHYVTENEAGSPTSFRALEDFAAVWRASVMPLLHVGYLVERYTIEHLGSLDVTNPEAPEYVWDLFDQISAPTSDIGADTNAPLPTYATANVRKLTGGGGTTVFQFGPPDGPSGPERRFRGRIGIGSITEDRTTGAGGNELVGAFITNLEVAVAQLTTINVVNGGDAIDMVMVVLSKIKDGVPRTRAVGTIGVVAYQAIVDLQVATQVGTQNSRKKRNNA